MRGFVKNNILCMPLLLWGAVGPALGDGLSSLGLKSNQASKRGAGSAAILSGVTVVQQIFVSDMASGWSSNQKSATLADVEQALAFLIEQSQRYGVEASFKCDRVADAMYDKVVPTDAFVNPVWTEEVVRSATRVSGNQLVEQLKKETGADNVLVCLHVNKPALSYNLAHYDQVDRAYLAERMILYTRYPDGRPTAVATYAHEILHLFGAGDLYFPYDKSRWRKETARRVFPDDIMYRVDYDLSQLSVGVFTAFRVGWSEKLKSQYEVFQD